MKNDDLPIRKVILDRDSALGSKNLDALMAHYAPEVVVFDAQPPFQMRGPEALRNAWEMCFPCFPGSFGVETRDLCISVGEDLAVAHWLWRFTGLEKDHPAMKSWMRNTASFILRQGRWLIVHEHYSVPFDPHTCMAVFTLDVD